MKRVESLKKGLEVMEAFTVSTPRLKLQEVADRTKLPKATAYRMLRTLISLDYISYDAAAALYQLTPKVMSLGFTVLSNLELRDAARPHMEEFARITNQSVGLAILDGAQVLLVDRVKQPALLDLDLRVGSRLPTGTSSAGRAILAFMDPDLVDNLMPAILASAQEDEEAMMAVGFGGEVLLQKLAEVRERGYALNDEDTISGLRAASAPIFNAAGMVEGALNLTVFSQMTTRDHFQGDLVPQLLRTARYISRTRGHRPKD